MATIRVSGLNNYNEDRKLTLNNGDIIIAIANRISISHFMVSSYRGEVKREPYCVRPKSTRSYCCLIDLATGYPAFEEPCSRNTTLKRILSHLAKAPCSNNLYAPDDIIQLKNNEYAVMITPTKEEEHGTD
ncbi:hypothetical protein MKC54_09400 [[Clostridium] innocuum]|nr:hypothetical protein [[Clostridium] innocuum]MCR0577101.1 hypothetical protein [[Clostridium] innocuum]